MGFKVGNKVKRPKGGVIYEVINVNSKHIFGKYCLLNIETNKKYFFNNTRIKNFELYDPFKPKDIKKKYLKFNFKNGI